MKLTSQQRAALTTRDVSVALDAGAGCGKTFVLTERFLSHLDPELSNPPAKLHELIAITFTDAAAREMRDRIRRACLDRLQDASAATGDYWLSLLREIDAARVNTIHGFCGELIRSHAVELGIDPLFQVLENSAAQVMKSETLDNALRHLLEQRDPRATPLATALELRGLKERVNHLFDAAHSPPLQEWMDRSPEELVEAWQSAYEESYLPFKLQSIARSTPFQTVLKLAPLATPAKTEFAEARADLFELRSRLLEGEADRAQLDRIAALARVKGLTDKNDWPDQATFDRYKNACGKLRDATKNLKSLGDQSQLLAAAETGQNVASLARNVVAEYTQAKRSASLLDFDDLLYEAHRLLTSPEFAPVQQKLQKEIRLLLVDEFQDTDRTQVAIVKALVGAGLTEGQLFFVGDFKQSIYRFRGAEPEVFRELQGETPRRGQLPLARNFRSQPAVLEFVNRLFAPLFGAGYQHLEPERTQVTPGPAVEFLWTPLAGNTSAVASRQAEARTIARRIRAMLDEGAEIVGERSEEGHWRPRAVRPGDIALLFRAKGDVPYYEQALRDEGVDHFFIGGQAFYAQQEVYDVANLLTVVASPSDEVSLAGALRSPFFSLLDETLFWLAHRGGGLGLGLAKQKLDDELSAAENAKLQRARETLAELRQMKGRATVAEILITAINRTTFDAVVLSEFLGERKLSNLQKLVEQARTFDHYRPGDLDGFVRQLREFVVKQPKEALAASRNEAADEVQLMSVHSAKGLEFPVVFVVDIDRRTKNYTDSAAFNPTLGPLCHAADHDKEFVDGLDIHRAIEQASDEQEMHRLFYVACTRAADYLVLSSTCQEDETMSGPWLKTLAEHFDLRTGLQIASGEEAPEDAADAPLARVSMPIASGDPKTPRERRKSSRKLLAAARTDASPAPLPESISPIAVRGEAIRRFSVSKLTGELRHASSRPAAVSLDAALRGAVAGVDPRGMGTLVHAILERMQLDGENPVGQWAQALAPLHVTRNWRQAASEAEQLVQTFLRSAQYQQMQAAARVEREVEFLLRWPLDQSAPDESRSGRMPWDGAYLQGYIDCLVESPSGAMTVLDYKTNRVGGEDVQTEAEKYHLQLYVYALAVEQATGRSPDDLCIHFMRPGEEVHIEWDPAARGLASQLIDQAIAGVREKAVEAATAT